MEQQQRSLVFTAAVGLIILAIIVGSIYYLVKFIQGRVASSRQATGQTQQVAEASASASVSVQDTQTFQIASQAPIASAIPQGQVPQTGGNVATDKKVFNSGNFQMAYPKNWGVLSCNNGKNIELDPQNPTDSSIACDLAVKPITVVIADIKGCEGQASKVGNIDVVKSQASEGNYTKYQWCTKTTPVLNITHRVSQGGERATSKQDFSKQIEDMIASLSFARGS